QLLAGVQIVPAEHGHLPMLADDPRHARLHSPGENHVGQLCLRMENGEKLTEFATGGSEWDRLAGGLLRNESVLGLLDHPPQLVRELSVSLAGLAGCDLHGDRHEASLVTVEVTLDK